MSDFKDTHSNAYARIYLFESACARKGGLNSLKEFMTFLKFHGAPARIDFSLAGTLETLHANLSIKENYILDSVPTSLIKNKDDNFTLTAENLKNDHLKELILLTSCLNRKVSELCDHEKKVVSIVKGLLSQSEFLFLENPDQGLSPQHLDIIKAALSFEAQKNNRSILIRPQAQEKWLDLAGNVVTKPARGSYESKPNELIFSNLYQLKTKKAA